MRRNYFLRLCVRFYQRWISPWLGPRCRFYPSCSQYAYEALQHYALLPGLWLGLKRFCRCHPFSLGGYDPLEVPNKANAKAKEVKAQRQSNKKMANQ